MLYDDCHDLAVATYSVAATPDVDSWSVDIEITGPDGTSAGSDFVSSFFDPATGTVEAFFCGSEMPGTYTVSGSGTWSDYETDRYDVPFSLGSGTFTMRLPKSKTTAKGKQTARAYVVNVTVKDERPNGYFPTDFANVKLQKLVGGGWVQIPGAKDYTSDGRVSFTVSTKGPSYKVRAVKPQSSSLGKSVSKPVSVP